jgi:hypothetical protein
MSREQAIRARVAHCPTNALAHRIERAARDAIRREDHRRELEIDAALEVLSARDGDAFARMCRKLERRQ